MSENAIRILIADDHPVVRDGLAAIIDTQPDFEVVGGAANGKEAVEMAVSLLPDVVLLDLEMPELDGVEALRQMRETCGDQVRVIVFTAFDTDERILDAVQAGAKGYLLKGARRDDIFQAIRVVSAGGSLLEPVVASKLLEHMSGQRAEAAALDQLTEREMEVLRLLARGRTNKEIATELFITERTVKFYVSAILSKLGAGNRTEAVTIAAQRGLVKL
jgi:two-component system, NarL family, response regulator LiaR